MTEESKEIDPKVAAVADAPESDDEVEETGQTGDGGALKRKKKSKSKKVKDALTVGPTVKASSSDPTKASLTDAQFQQLLSLNPSLKNEVAHMDPAKVKELMKNMDLSTALSGLVSLRFAKRYMNSVTNPACKQSMDGTNKTDMASYKFWQTQPVTSFGKT
jgi:glycylpeptide N-tetradecanoyltransferase